MVLTHTDLWYVPAYFALMLLSPIINKGMDNLSRKQNLVLICLFVAYNIWAGWIWGGNFNPTGYTVIQLIMVYMIGRLIHMYSIPSSSGIFKWFLLYILSMIGVFITSFFFPVVKAFAYNSPAVLLMSVSLFICFLGIKLKSHLINYLAKSAFAVYLIHKTPVIWGGVLKPFLINKWETLQLWEYTILIIIVSICIYIVVAVPDLLRRKLSGLILKLFSKNI